MIEQRKRHNLRQMADGRWVCSGGPRHGTRRDGKITYSGGGCDFFTTDYAQAVNHATANGATPPDMPREMWA